MRQRSINQQVECRGVGIHSGAAVRLSVKKAPPGHGIEFKRKGFNDESAGLFLSADKVRGEDRGTRLEGGGLVFKTVEHLLAAIYALEIDNIIVELDAEEIPILDGSAADYVSLLEQAGIVEQKKEQACLKIKSATSIKDDAGPGFLIALPAEALKISLAVEYDDPLGIQLFTRNINRAVFTKEIAAARTFGWTHEIEALLASSLAQGANKENAIGVAPEGYTTKLRWSNEPIRHKMLDLIGDLSGLRKRLKAHIIGYRTNHKMNVQFMKKLAAND
jgi:UDP-3-O-[3-hydroxymyristoyl] N-acetylglucosamine deacetylase